VSDAQAEDALLLDTHIALWLDTGDDRLAKSTRDRIDACWKHGGSIGLSAVSVWEIALLVDTGRIALDVPVESWVTRFVARPGVQSVPLGYRAASRAYRLRELEHRDPADRLLIATAIELSWPLVTYDERVLRFADAHGRQYGFAIRR
jgi:PIN domain nuclease of toxin-antitoxin system